ncbi:zinc-ribbon domain-containing protein [uncultured Maribacter sp.]|uniref:zinc-ribbon domain-containing protein n=1 Tax=uncultured Maribacter sp. TaxID=431308 RepID=UPI00261148AA|nr:zinc-ribbon domain-containing protein [uncultured Maribacter sp.]
MIIFGKRTAYIGSKTSSNNIICTHCETKGEIIYSVFRSHAHIFWIPVFPIGKRAVSECQHCKKTLSFKEMSPEMKKECNTVKNEIKGPIWQFSGLFIFALLIVFAGFAGKKDKENEAQYLSSPLAGDIYDYKTENSQYSTMRIIHVSADSVYVQLNDFEIGRSSKIYKIDKEENYSKKAYGYSKDEIKTMYDQRIIIDIDRE